MGRLYTACFTTLSLTIIFTSLVLHHIGKPKHVPTVEEVYWGPGNVPKEENLQVFPMNITFSEKMIADLKHRLGNTRYTPPLNGIAQEDGFNSNILEEIVDFWQTEYPFKKREAYFNSYLHFKANIQGLDIHFMRIKPKHAEDLTVLPLLLLHGWPGSVREFYDLIPLLTTRHRARDFVFEVIAPSLPGVGHSQAAAKPGFGATEMAVVMKNLMLRLGHSQFYVHGTDWGSNVAAEIATLFRDNVLGLHTNMCTLSTPLSLLKRFARTLYLSVVVDGQYKDRYYPFSALWKTTLRESGYYHIQAAKPDAVGVGLNDSPAGLVAYILDKFSSGTNRAFRARQDGRLMETIKYEALLDNAMIYWLTGTMTSAMRIYAESPSTNNHRVHIVVPSACANFKHEISYTPVCILKDRYVNLVQNTHYDHGGHFIAMEYPDLLAEDLYSAVEKMHNKKRNA